MSEDLEKRVRDLESSVSYARGVAATFAAVGLGIGALAVWATTQAHNAMGIADLIDAKKPTLITEIENEAKARLAWKRVDLASKDNFNDRCSYRFVYRNPNSDLVVEYAVEVAGKTLAGAITASRSFNVQAGDKGWVYVVAEEAQQSGKFPVDWIEAQCLTPGA